MLPQGSPQPLSSATCTSGYCPPDALSFRCRPAFVPAIIPLRE